jgi:uncharacterized damage-inducible protein DinB
MDARDHLVRLAGYHAWASARLMDCLAAVSDQNYRRDCGLAFRSVHGTLNHLLLADRLWYGRFTGKPITVAGLDEELVADRDELRLQVLDIARRWCGLLPTIGAERFDGDLVFVTTEGTVRSMPFAATLAHVFNHGTHHRGQISALLTALGEPAPELDLYYYILQQRADGGGDPIEQADAYLQARFEELDAEISHYPSPIARCDLQLTKLIEQRAEVLGHQRRLRQQAAEGGVSSDLASAMVGMLAAEVYDGVEAEALRRRLSVLAGVERE